MSELGPEPANWTVETLREVAEFWNVKEATVRHWRCENPRMPGEPGKWHLPTIHQWAIDRERRKRPFSETEELLQSPDESDWKRRWIRSKALLTEEQLGRSQADLVSLDEITPLLSRLADRLDSAMLTLEARHGTSAADIMRMPLERLRESLSELQVE